jgi:hypothetical protein
VTNPDHKCNGKHLWLSFFRRTFASEKQQKDYGTTINPTFQETGQQLGDRQNAHRHPEREEKNRVLILPNAPII